jgi:hypothetical protein
VKRYGRFLQAFPGKDQPPERKMEAFLTELAHSGVAASTQNQAFNSILFFYRDVLKIQLGSVHALRAKRTAPLRDCPTVQKVSRLLAAVPDVYGYVRDLQVVHGP